jgi:hypothetical protein
MEESCTLGTDEKILKKPLDETSPVERMMWHRVTINGSSGVNPGPDVGRSPRPSHEGHSPVQLRPRCC